LALDDVIKKINEDAEKRIAELNKEQEKEFQQIEKALKEKYENLEEKLKEEKKEHRRKTIERTLSTARSKLNIQFLAYKKELLRSVFDQAQNEVVKLSDDEYANFFIRNLKDINPKKGEIIIGKEDYTRLKKALSKKFDKLEYKKNEDFDYGLFLVVDNIRYDYTIKSIFSELAESLEAEISQTLFGKMLNMDAIETIEKETDSKK